MMKNETDMFQESDPDGTDQHESGAKLDAGKPQAGVLLDFREALLDVACLGTFGAEKYSRGGWQDVPNGVQRYTDALMRHLLKEGPGYIALDEETELLHATAVAWNALARLELIQCIQREASPQIISQIHKASIDPGFLKDGDK